MDALKENLQNINANIMKVNDKVTMTTTTTTATTTMTTTTTTTSITTTTITATTIPLTPTKTLAVDSIKPPNNLAVNTCAIVTNSNNNNNNNNSSSSSNNNISSITSNNNISNTNNNTVTSNGQISTLPIAITCGTSSPSKTIVNAMTNTATGCGAITIPLLQALSSIDTNGKQQITIATTTTAATTTDDSNNASLTSGASDSQRSLSAAPSASSSPLLSPTGKIFGRNANGTMVATIRPNNEAEVQLYRVLQKASLLTYYDTLLEMGGDDVQQLYEAGEDEFLEIMALVGMASKPLHVRRLQKALHEWANNPQQFQTPISNNIGQFDTPAKTTMFFNIEQSPFHYQPRPKLPTYSSMASFNPTPLVTTLPLSTSAHMLSQICNVPITVPTSLPISLTTTILSNTTIPTTVSANTTSLPVPVLPSTLSTSLTNERTQSLLNNQSNAAPITGITMGVSASNTAHQVTSSSPQLTPILSEMQLARIKMGAEKVTAQLPQREPRAHTSKKRTSRELEQIISMDKNDPKRMEEIRKYSAIYGRFDCKRRPEKPLTLHEVCVNEAAAQLCRLVPALLTRRDELFPLARQIVKDVGFGHSASITRYGNIFNQIPPTNTTSTNSSTAITTRSSSSIAALDYESTEANVSKKQRLCFTEPSDNFTSSNNNNRESNDDGRYNLFAIYQKFAEKSSFYLTDLAKIPLNKSIAMDFEQQDNETHCSFKNSSANSPEGNGDKFGDLNKMYNRLNRPFSSTIHLSNNNHNNLDEEICTSTSSTFTQKSEYNGKRKISNTIDRFNMAYENLEAGNEVQVISACGNHIIAVANPALVMSPTLNKSLNLT